MSHNKSNLQYRCGLNYKSTTPLLPQYLCQCDYPQYLCHNTFTRIPPHVHSHISPQSCCRCLIKIVQATLSVRLVDLISNDRTNREMMQFSTDRTNTDRTKPMHLEVMITNKKACGFVGRKEREACPPSNAPSVHAPSPLA